MKEPQFEDYCQRLKLPEPGIAYLRGVVNSDPARRVHSAGGNATVRYPSRKNGFVVQAESRTVELPFIYTQEYDDGVLGYFDQPTPITLSYVAKSGRRTGALHTPDFLSLYEDAVEIIECKAEEELLRLTEDMPNRYQRSAEGCWICPPGQEVARGYGFRYRVVSSAELDPHFTRNITFMADYLDERAPQPDPNAKARIVEAVSKRIGISIKELLDLCPGTRPEGVYSVIGKGYAFVDLRQAPIIDWDKAFVFGNPELARACRVLTAASQKQWTKNGNGVLVAVGTEVLWHERRYSVANHNASIVILTTEGQSIEIQRDVFDAAVSRGEMVQVTGVVPTTNPKVVEATLAATPEELAEALKRLKAVQASDPAVAGVTPRTLDRWKKDYREAEEVKGSGFLGLLPRERQRGNRTLRFPPAVYDLADKVINDDYLTLKQKGRLPVYARFRDASVSAGHAPPSYQWFCDRLRELDQYRTTKARKGKRAAYPFEPRTQSTGSQRTCDRPFERVHIDHTQLDLQLISSTTGKSIGRPWLTLAIDECTRRILAFYVSFDEPSYVCCMAVLREMVRIHGRLPDRVVVDNGKEFSSCDFELLAARYEMAIEKRPPAKPRFGSVIERIFGTINTQLLYQLWGNTQATKKNVRTVTKSNDPANLACWTLAEFDQLLSEYLYRIYDAAVHSTLGMSPAEAFVKAIERTGQRPTRLIAYDESFEIWCMPSTRTGLAKVIPRAGIKVTYLYYWTDEFRNAGVEGTKVRVKVDPFNAGIVYALVKGRWLRCVSEYHHFFNGRSPKEIKIATQELRKAKSGLAVGKLISAKRLLDFMSGPEEVERVKQQRQKDRERQLAAGVAEIPANPEKVMLFPGNAEVARQPREHATDEPDFNNIEEASEI
jgi:putative transposase